MTNRESDPLISHIQKGDRLRREGRLKEAEAEYRAALAIDPYHVEIRQKLLDLSLEIGRANNVDEGLDDDFGTEGGLDTAGAIDPIERAQQDQQASQERAQQDQQASQERAQQGQQASQERAQQGQQASQDPPPPETVQDEDTNITATSLPSEQFLEAAVTEKSQSNKIVLPTQLFEVPQSHWRYAPMCVAGLLALAVVSYVGWKLVHEGSVQTQPLTKEDSSSVGVPKDLATIPPDPSSDASYELDNPKEVEGQLPLQHKETAKRGTEEPVPLQPDRPPPSKGSTVAESKESPTTGKSSYVTDDTLTPPTNVSSTSEDDEIYRAVANAHHSTLARTGNAQEVCRVHDPTGLNGIVLIESSEAAAQALALLEVDETLVAPYILCKLEDGDRVSIQHKLPTITSLSVVTSTTCPVGTHGLTFSALVRCDAGRNGEKPSPVPVAQNRTIQQDSGELPNRVPSVPDWDSLTKPLPRTQYIVERSTWPYSQPTIAHPINYRIGVGTVVNVVGQVGEEWFKIESKYERPPAYIRRSDVRVRE